MSGKEKERETTASTSTSSSNSSLATGTVTPTRSSATSAAGGGHSSSSSSGSLPSLLRRNNTNSLQPSISTNSISATSRSSPLLLDRPPTLKRAPSTNSVSLATAEGTAIPFPASRASTPIPPPSASKEDDDAGEASDSGSSSSGFESLLQRVANKSSTALLDVGGSDSDNSKSKRRKSKGKEKEKERGGGDKLTLTPHEDNNNLADSGILNSAEAEDDGDGDESDEAEIEVVGREEGQADPRDMLREQLRKTENLGIGKRRNTGNWDGSASAELKKDPTPLDVGAIVTLEAPATRSRYSPRRYFILSSAGKLIFTTDEEEGEAAGYVGVMQAVVSIFADEGDKLRYIDAGPTKISILLKPPLYLVCVSDWGEPESILRGHLEYLYLQVLSVVTHSQLTAIFARRSNFDLRRLMEGTEAFFKTLTATLQTSLPILTNCLEVYRIDPGVRDEIAKLLTPGKVDNLLYAVVIAHSRVVTLIRPKKHSVHPTDLHLLLSTIASSTTFRTPDHESWIPICLPRFNATGFLHAYISYASEGVGVVFVSGDKEGFFKMKELGEGVKGRLKKAGLVHKLEKERSLQEYSLGELAIPGVRHFLYKSKAFVQVTFPAWEGDYIKDDNKFRLLTLYQRLHDALHPRTIATSGTVRPAAKLIYMRTEHEAVLGWTTSNFELYLALSPLLPQTAVVSAARAVTRWVKQEELSLFLTSAPSF